MDLVLERLNILHNLLKDYPVLHLRQNSSEIYNSKMHGKKMGFRFDCLSNQSQETEVKKKSKVKK